MKLKYKTDFANARTFSFLHEIEMLLENNLIKGGDLNNAIVYVDKKISDETMDKLKKAFNRKSVSVKPNGILDNLNLHYQNEAARHKLNTRKGYCKKTRSSYQYRICKKSIRYY